MGNYCKRPKTVLIMFGVIIASPWFEWGHSGWKYISLWMLEHRQLHHLGLPSIHHLGIQLRSTRHNPCVLQNKCFAMLEKNGERDHHRPLSDENIVRNRFKSITGHFSGQSCWFLLLTYTCRIQLHCGTLALDWLQLISDILHSVLTLIKPTILCLMT